MLYKNSNGQYTDKPWGMGKKYGTNKDSAALHHFYDTVSSNNKSEPNNSDTNTTNYCDFSSDSTYHGYSSTPSETHTTPLLCRLLKSIVYFVCYIATLYAFWCLIKKIGMYLLLKIFG